jgi:anti-sigma B factor antagonist
MDLQIDHRDKEGIRILDLGGSIVFGESEDQLRTRVVTEIKQGKVKLILNFARVKEIDDDGLGALVLCHVRIRRACGALKLLSLAHVHMELFVLMKLEGVFEVFQDEQDAVNSFFPDRAVHRFDILEFVEEQTKPRSSDGEI